MLIGVDIAEIARFKNISDKFMQTCFTEEERASFKAKRPWETAAANFAAKEAFSKAIGTGVRGFELSEISVLRKCNGKPYFVFSDNIKSILSRMAIDSVEVTISHDGGFAVAVAIAEQKKGCECFARAVAKTDTDDEGVISYKTVKNSIPVRKRESHKGDFGRIFIVAGSKGLTGAGILASKAAVRSGGGLVTLACCDSLNTVFETALHEVMTYPMADNDGVLSRECVDNLLQKADKADVIAFGCGLSDTKEIYEILRKIIYNSTCPLIIDADGLNALSRNINILKKAKSPVVLTPHIGEFSRLSGLSAEEIYADRAGVASAFAVKWGVTVVLKSDRTVVAFKDGRVYSNLLGNSGMATGGSGDALTGVIASFIGQGIENPVLSAVYIHSLAGDLAADDKGEYGMMPTDIVENIPCAISLVCGKEE